MLTAMAVLAVIGLLAVLNMGRRQVGRTVDGVRYVGHLGGVVFRAVFTAAVIVAVQWFVIAEQQHNAGVLIAVLAVPALFAGASIARLLTVSDAVPSRQGGGYR